MGVLIDEVFTEVSSPSTQTETAEDRQTEPSGVPAASTEITLCDQIRRLQKRQLRLIAD